jgi:hypothetical protein
MNNGGVFDRRFRPAVEGHNTEPESERRIGKLRA